MIDLVATRIYKETTDTAVGASFENDAHGRLIIKAIRPDGLLSGTKLRVGYNIVQINRLQCKTLPSQDATSFVRNLEGPIMIMADKGGLVTAIATKESRDSLVGLTVARYGNEVFIKKMAPRSIFEDTDLMAGMRLVSINDELVHSARDAHDRLLNGVGAIHILAEMPPENFMPRLEASAASYGSREHRSHGYSQESRDPATEPDPDTIVVEAMKVSMSSRVGIKMVDCENGVFVDEVSDDGLLRDSGLQGLRLISINGHPVLHAQQAIVQCKEVVGRLKIVADKTALPSARLPPKPVPTFESFRQPKTIIVEVTKETRDEKLGVKVTDHENGVFFSNISDYSPLANTGLLGRRLITVNQHRIDSAKQAAGIFKSLEGLLTIVADNTLAGIATPSRSEQWMTPLTNKQRDGVITVTAMKNYSDTKVGIKVVGYRGDVYVQQISEGGVLTNTLLRPGQRIVSVNRNRIQDAAQAIAICKEAVGSLTIVAEEIPHEYLVERVREIAPPSFTLTLSRKALMMKGSLSNMDVFQNQDKIGILKNSGPKSSLVLYGLVGGKFIF